MAVVFVVARWTHGEFSELQPAEIEPTSGVEPFDHCGGDLGTAGTDFRSTR
jgi:hypothetical protein